MQRAGGKVNRRERKAIREAEGRERKAGKREQKRESREARGEGRRGGDVEKVENNPSIAKWEG